MYEFGCEQLTLGARRTMEVVNQVKLIHCQRAGPCSDASSKKDEVVGQRIY